VATFEKHADLEKRDLNSRKSRANSQNLIEPFLRSKKQENLYGHCAINKARRILSKGSTLLRSCCFGSKKLHFQKNFYRNFNAVVRVRLEMTLKLQNANRNPEWMGDLTPVAGPILGPISKRRRLINRGISFWDCLISRFYFVPHPSNLFGKDSITKGTFDPN